MPVRRSGAAIGAAVALAAGTLALGPASLAHATPATGGSGSGTADAVILKTGLDVSLLNKSADVPLNVALNEVHAPADANRTLLTAKLDGVDGGQPFNVLRAKVADTKATADAGTSEGYANLTDATVTLPGLPLLGLIKIDAVTSKATCATGKAPTADTNFVGDVTVLGKKVSVRASGTTTVDVAGLGKVSLDLAKTVSTSESAASTAVQLQVRVNPGKLGVADIGGDLTLVKASCAAPGGGNGASSGGSGDSSGGSSGSGSSGGGSASGGSSADPTTGGSSGGSGSTSAGSSGSGSGTKAQGASTQNLAETGAGSATPYIAGGAAVLVVAGGAAVYFSSRRKKTDASS
jgi:hypothetical protein